MPVIDLGDLLAERTRTTPLTGVDAGEKTLGVAFSDALWTSRPPIRSSAGRSSPTMQRPSSG